jgi:hypothetical protein
MVIERVTGPAVLAAVGLLGEFVGAAFAIVLLLVIITRLPKVVVWLIHGSKHGKNRTRRRSQKRRE